MRTRRALVALALWIGLAASLSAIVATRVTVATTPTLIYTGAGGGSSVLIRNAGAASVYLGPVTVTTATGFELLAGDAVRLPMGANDPLYGIVATGSQVVHVLEPSR